MSRISDALGREALPRFARLLDQALVELPSPGLNAAVLVEDELVWTYATGLARCDPDAPLTSRHLHRIGSITKLFTAHAILMLREDGLLDLDAPVRTYLPEFGQPGTERVALRHILCHGSGIPTNGLLDVWRTGTFPDRQEFKALVARMPVVARPMVHIKYSNMAFSMLGLIIENVAGVSYEHCIAERLLRPLGMTETAFYLSPEQEAMAVPGHTMKPYIRRFETAPFQDLKSWNACGMLASTAADTLKLARLQWTPGSLLSESTREEMHRLHSMDMDTPGWKVGYGLGWRLYRVADRIFAGHGGGYIGNRCQIMLSLADRVAVALYANCNQAINVVSISARILGDTIEALKPLRGAPPRVAPVPIEWKPLLGSYAVPHWQEIRIEYGPAGLRITSPLEPGPGIPLRPLDSGRFLMLAGRGAGEELTVARTGPDGEAQDLSLGGMIYSRI